MALAYIANESTNKILSIDTANNTFQLPTSGISVGSGPFGVGFAPDGSLAVVANNTATPSTGSLSIIDATHNTVQTVYVSPNGWPNAVAVGTLANGHLCAYVTVKNADTTANDFVFVIDITNSYSTSWIDLGGVGYNPTGIAITPNGAYVYVANSTNFGTGAGTITIIRTSDNDPIHNFSLESYACNPYGVAITPDGATAYVSMDADVTSGGQVAFFSANGSIPSSAHIYVADASFKPRGIAITPDGNMVYVSNLGEYPTDPSVGYFPTGTTTPTTNFIYSSHFSQPYGVAITPDSSTVYVSDSTLLTIDATTHGVSTVPSTGGVSFGLFVQQPLNGAIPNTPFVGGASEWFGC